MTTPVIAHRGYMCVSFYYHMAGINMGGLTFYVIDSMLGVRPVWTQAGHAGKDWIYFNKTIYASENMQVSWNGLWLDRQLYI